MPGTTRITVTGIDDVRRKLSGPAFKAAMRPPMEASLRILNNELAKYPSPPSRGTFRANFTSARQRRAFFALLRRGLITVPYRRTGTLGRSWTTSITDAGTRLSGVIGTALSYAKYVQGAGFQHPGHAGRWLNDLQAILVSEPKIVNKFLEAVRAALR